MKAGFVPGCAFLIGSYYTRNEFLKRYTVFFSGAIIAGAFNGCLSYLLAKADGTANLAGWRWIFLVCFLWTLPWHETNVSRSRACLLALWHCQPFSYCPHFQNILKCSRARTRLSYWSVCVEMGSQKIDLAASVNKCWRLSSTGRSGLREFSLYLDSPSTDSVITALSPTSASKGTQSQLQLSCESSSFEIFTICKHF